jgi:hypothetical protein
MSIDIITGTKTYDEFVEVFERKRSDFMHIAQSPFIRQSIFLAKPISKEDWEMLRDVTKPNPKKK